MRSFLWFDDEDCQSTALVGGKAANLARLCALHSVPPGFAIPATAFAAGAVHFDADLCGAYEELAERCCEPEVAVAVRSSAIDEDGAGASFAGQYSSYLNVRGAAAVLEAVAGCVASAHNPEALAYRARHGLGPAAVAVIVQALVRSDVSAVVFSANPVNSSREEILINSSWGLGESIVGGTVTPDTYVVSRSRRTLLSRFVERKTRMTVLAEAGTREVDVPRGLQDQPSLEDAQAVAMAELALKLEAHTGWETDVECALAGGELFLLQCRPITTLQKDR